MEFKVKARKWGNSIAFIVPSQIAQEKKIRENDEVVIEIIKRPLAGELFGKFPRKSKRTAQEIKDDARKGWK